MINNIRSGHVLWRIIHVSGHRQSDLETVVGSLPHPGAVDVVVESSRYDGILTDLDQKARWPTRSGPRVPWSGRDQ